jgi:hypothetical protein
MDVYGQGKAVEPMEWGMADFQLTGDGWLPIGWKVGGFLSGTQRVGQTLVKLENCRVCSEISHEES